MSVKTGSRQEDVKSLDVAGLTRDKRLKKLAGEFLPDGFPIISIIENRIIVGVKESPC